MMKRLLFLALSAFAMNVGAHGLTMDDAQNIASAYGYVYAQNNVVKHIRERFPELLPQVMVFESRWSRRFPSVDKKLAKHLQCFQLTEEKLLELLNKKKDLQELRRSVLPKDAATALERLEYFKYRLENPDELDRKTFTTLNDLVFDDQPSLELSADGIPFSSKGHPKAQGLDIQLKVPASWDRREATRPHIVQKWVKKDEGKIISLMVLVAEAKELQEFWTKESLIDMKTTGDVWELFGDPSPRMAKENVFITEYERMPAVILNSVVKKTRGTFSTYMDISALYLCYNGKFINIQFTVNGPTLDETLQLFDKYQLCRDVIFNTLYLPQSYQ